MKLRNNFPDYSWTTFMDEWRCWFCEMNTADCLHHIVGRGNGDSTVESSILNAAPLCNHKCHIANHGKISTDDWKKIFLQKTFDYLTSRQYEFQDNDKKFVKKYEKYYRRDQVSLARKGLKQSNILGPSLDREKPTKKPVSPIPSPIQKPRKIRRK